MKRGLTLILLIAMLGVTQMQVKSYMDSRPIAVKLGFMPSGKLLRYLVGDQKSLVAEGAVLKVLFYFGSLVEKWQNRVAIPPEYFNMFKMIESAVLLDPYNMDAYYFAQAAFTWEVGRAQEVNSLLSYGMKYRTWDWYLPYFKGFNQAYFLRDYKGAAESMKKAAELSGNELFSNLAARYFYESGHNELGIAFLRSMMTKEHDPKVKKIFALRLDALEKTEKLEAAVKLYASQKGHKPKSLHELVRAGFIESIPSDPYGGRFYLDAKGKVRSTSSFAISRKNGEKAGQ